MKLSLQDINTYYKEEVYSSSLFLISTCFYPMGWLHTSCHTPSSNASLPVIMLHFLWPSTCTQGNRPPVMAHRGSDPFRKLSSPPLRFVASGGRAAVLLASGLLTPQATLRDHSRSSFLQWCLPWFSHLRTLCPMPLPRGGPPHPVRARLSQADPGLGNDAHN